MNDPQHINPNFKIRARSYLSFFFFDKTRVMRYTKLMRYNTLGLFILLLIFSGMELTMIIFEDLYTNSLTEQMEKLSHIFIILNNFLFIIVSLLIYSIRANKREFMSLLILLNLLISASFYTKNVLIFFMAFEAIVIPMSLIIIV